MLCAEGKNKILYTKKQRFIKKHFVISIIFTNFAKCNNGYRRTARARPRRRTRGLRQR